MLLCANSLNSPTYLLHAEQEWNLILMMEFMCRDLIRRQQPDKFEWRRKGIINYHRELANKK